MGNTSLTGIGRTPTNVTVNAISPNSPQPSPLLQPRVPSYWLQQMPQFQRTSAAVARQRLGVGPAGRLLVSALSFIPAEEREIYEAAGLLLRHSFQFHWQNQG